MSKDGTQKLRDRYERRQKYTMHIWKILPFLEYFTFRPAILRVQITTGKL